MGQFPSFFFLIVSPTVNCAAGEVDLEMEEDNSADEEAGDGDSIDQEVLMRSAHTISALNTKYTLVFIFYNSKQKSQSLPFRFMD